MKPTRLLAIALLVVAATTAAGAQAKRPEKAVTSRPAHASESTARASHAPGARTWQVPRDHASLQAAIDAVAPFDTIEVAPGRYMESLVLSERQRGVVLRSTGGADSTFLVGGGDARLLTFDEVDTLITIVGFTFRGGRPQFDGGAVYAYRSRFEMRDCILRGNQTPGDGGAVALYESNAVLRDCRVEDNGARRGGGVFAGGSQLRLERNAISGNRAELEGGGVYCADGSIVEPGTNNINGNRPDELAGCTPAALPPNPHR